MRRHSGIVADTSLADFRLHARRWAAQDIFVRMLIGEINPGLTGPSIWIVVAQLRIVYTGWQAR